MPCISCLTPKPGVSPLLTFTNDLSAAEGTHGDTLCAGVGIALPPRGEGPIILKMKLMRQRCVLSITYSIIAHLNRFG